MKPLLALPVLALAAGAPPPLFEPLGVCSLDEAGAVCWDLRGAPLPTLTAQIDRLARTTPQSLGFVYGRKTRYLVVRQGEYRSLMLRGSSGNVQSLVLSGEGAPNLHAFRVAALPEATTETIVATVGAIQGEAVEVPFREGAKAVVEGVRIELGAVKVVNPEMNFSRRSGTWPFFGPGRWRFPLERTETTPMGSLAFVAIGYDGKPISYVDPNGKPIPPDKGKALAAEAFGPKRDWTRPASVEYAQIFAATMSAPSPVLWCSTNIDPKAIARLRVQRIAEHTEILGPFPLDPVGKP